MARQRAGKESGDVAEVKRLVGLLRMVIHTFGTNREVERKLGMRLGYLSRIFGGAVELRMEHVMAVCRALEMLPGEFFMLAYGGGSEALTEAGRKAFANLRPQGQAAPAPRKAQATLLPGAVLSGEEMDARVRSAIADLMLAFGKLFGSAGSQK